MSDSEGSLEPRRPSDPATASATAAQFASLSDDDSDDGRIRPAHAQSTAPRPPRSPTPSRSPSPSSVGEPANRSPSPEAPPRPRTPTPTLIKSANTLGARPDTVDLVHFPPNISLRPAITTSLQQVPQEQDPILFRLKPGIKKSKSAVDTLLDHLRENPDDPLSLPSLLQSNANLITWSDGSRTLAIGQTQFLLIDDTLASKHLTFRAQSERLYTCDARVRKVVRVQPTSTSDARTKLAMATARMRATSKQREGRTMLRCMDDRGEQQEMKAKMENMRKERERARLEAKRRQARERHVRPNRVLSVDQLESDYESEEDHVKKMEERMDAERLIKAKRAAAPRMREMPVKRRKAGGRRVVAADDDESDESD